MPAVRGWRYARAAARCIGCWRPFRQHGLNGQWHDREGELRYTPWGKTRYSSGTTPTDRRYTGQIEDAEIGLYFYNARYYDSALGRFVQADTVVLDLANPQSLNRYSYVYNNPLKFYDPDGHFPIIPLIVAVATLVLLGTGCSAPSPGPTPTPTRTPRPTTTQTPMSVDSPVSTPQASSTSAPANTSTPTNTPTPAYQSEDVTAVARMAALEAGGEQVFGDQRDQALTALSWVVVNRKNHEGWWDGSYAEIASSSEFNAVSRNPDYQPTDNELGVARSVLSDATVDPTGGAVWFHDNRLPVGEYTYDVQNTVGNTTWALYFYPNEKCPGGPNAETGCSQ